MGRKRERRGGDHACKAGDEGAGDYTCDFGRTGSRGRREFDMGGARVNEGLELAWKEGLTLKTRMVTLWTLHR